LLKGILVGIVIAVPARSASCASAARSSMVGSPGSSRGWGRQRGCGVQTHHRRVRLTVVSDLLLDYQDWLRLGGASLLYIGISTFTADPLRGTQSQRDHEASSPIMPRPLPDHRN
jgi:hypothetical protein